VVDRWRRGRRRAPAGSDTCARSGELVARSE
jgi:hypothetical protein